GRPGGTRIRAGALRRFPMGTGGWIGGRGARDRRSVGRRSDDAPRRPRFRCGRQVMRKPESPCRRLLTTAGLMVLLVASAPVATPVAAQRSGETEQGADRTRLEERIRARIAQIMRERLELDSAEE